VDVRARSLFPILSAEDFIASISFYGWLLGGVETYRQPDEGEPSFVVLRLGDSKIGISAPGETLHGRALRPVVGHRIELCVYVADVDEIVALMRRDGVPVVMEPADQAWGERVAYVADPDDNLVTLVA
jgi:lactoylglutathione lyase